MTAPTSYERVSWKCETRDVGCLDEAVVINFWLSSSGPMAEPMCESCATVTQEYARRFPPSDPTTVGYYLPILNVDVGSDLNIAMEVAFAILAAPYGDGG